MPETNIFEGKTTNEAIQKGLKVLGISKEEAEIKILDNEDKRSFFSILAPRIVKVEITKKEKELKDYKTTRKLEEVEANKAKNNLDSFLNQWLNKIKVNNIEYNIISDENFIKVNIEGDDLNYLIGHRGEVLNNLQIILCSIASKGLENKVRVLLNICGYKEKRQKSLEELADKLARTVIKTKKSITLEPMIAYERKIIHSKLQNNNKVKTTSIGEEPYRKVVISLK